VKKSDRCNATLCRTDGFIAIRAVRFLAPHAAVDNLNRTTRAGASDDG
jgi:hypothetical protein